MQATHFFQVGLSDFADNALQISDKHYPMAKKWCMQQKFTSYQGVNLNEKNFNISQYTN